MLRPRWTFISAVFVLSTGSVSAQPSDSTDVSAIVETNCTGGVTGGGNGVALHTNGHFVAWTQITAGAPRTETDLGIDKPAAVELTADLNAIDFATIVLNQRGNMTCSLTFRGNTVTWPIGDTEVPATVVEIHERLMGIGRE